MCVAESQDSPQGDANLQLWDLQSSQLIKALFQKKVDSWSVSANTPDPVWIHRTTLICSAGLQQYPGFTVYHAVKLMVFVARAEL